MSNQISQKAQFELSVIRDDWNGARIREVLHGDDEAIKFSFLSLGVVVDGQDFTDIKNQLVGLYANQPF